MLAPSSRRGRLEAAKSANVPVLKLGFTQYCGSWIHENTNEPVNDVIELS